VTEQSLAGRVAIVTGASRGLGRAIAEALIGEGVRVALFARPSASLDETAAALGESALACPCDIRSSDAVNAAVAKAAAHFGRIDILINNAAACLVNIIESVPDADVRAEIETNLMAPIWCSRAAIPHLRAAGHGDIINISSASVVAPTQFMTTYAATKAALECFSNGLRAELRDYGIRVTILRSGAMTTSVVDSWSEEQKKLFFDAYADSSAQSETGIMIDPAITAGSIVRLLRLPPEASVRLIEVTGR
jgi:NAD(P)-dependent dehydrogenase (short-subunit alcohol dehydrogenase family)